MKKKPTDEEVKKLKELCIHYKSLELEYIEARTEMMVYANEIGLGKDLAIQLG